MKKFLGFHHLYTKDALQSTRLIYLFVDAFIFAFSLFYSACLSATSYENILQRYETDKLVLSGIRQQSLAPSGFNVLQACFKTPAGFYVYAVVGELQGIGKNLGAIAEIGLDYVVVSEFFETENDEWVEKKTKIFLSEELKCDWKNSIPNLGVPPEDEE
jgi:hypothetical protein